MKKKMAKGYIVKVTSTNLEDKTTLTYFYGTKNVIGYSKEDIAPYFVFKCRGNAIRSFKIKDEDIKHLPCVKEDDFTYIWNGLCKNRYEVIEMKRKEF
jgi:hypothetical protein